MQVWHKSFIRMTVGMALSLMAPSFATANDLGDGMFAYDQGLYREAFEIWRPIAESGDITAQTLLAMVYERGEGVSRNPRLAALWYRRAAEAGHPQAQFQIGRYYRDGLGVERSLPDAFAWFSLAAQSIPKNASGENSATKALVDLSDKMDAVAAENGDRRLLELLEIVPQQ